MFAKLITFSLLMISLCFGLSRADEGKGVGIRPSILAGSWYPADPTELRRSIEHYLSQAQVQPLRGELVALIVPHAGHRYSGPTAAYAYKILQGQTFSRVIVLGPSHQFGFSGASVGLQNGFQTPLGVMNVDQSFGRKLLTPDSLIRWLPDAHAYEHSIEIQLPFLQTVLKQTRLVPIVMGDDAWTTCSRLAQKLIENIKGPEKTLLIASSDLSHFYPAAQAKKLDQEFIRQVRDLSPENLYAALQAEKTEACGRAPVLTVMLAAKALGANQALILHYAHSGEVNGDNERVVGYVAIALVKK
jgi:AmmeMemoRadiSam system protein B